MLTTFSSRFFDCDVLISIPPLQAGKAVLKSSLIDSGGYYFNRDLKSVLVSGNIGTEVANFKLKNEYRDVIMEGKLVQF